ncbi:MAG TPA: DUF1822 family protein, partial [Allocoleopsis sp.]
NQTGKNYAYINSLVRGCFIKWMREKLELGNQQFIVNIPEIWEFVNGSSVTFKPPNSSLKKRLILIPSEQIDMDEFTIPQEWVDIPNWAGDYYVAVQVDFEEKYLHIWGYVSRQTLKQKKDYDPIFRNYYVDADYLIDEMNLLWIAAEICAEKGDVELLGELSLQEGESLINQLSKVSRYSPRLDVDFERWGKLLNNQQFLRKLYQKRTESIGVKIFRSITDWLTGIYEENLKTFDDFIEQKRQSLVFLGHSLEEFRSTSLPLTEYRSIPLEREIKELYQKQDQIVLPGNLSSEEALVYLLENTDNQTILWECAEYLQKINPDHPSNAMRKIIDLGMQLMGYPVALMVAALPQKNEKIAVLLRVYPMGDQICLPERISLNVLDENGNKIRGLEAIARDNDAYIQLYFRGDKKERFGVCVSLQSAKITEYFEV